MQKVSIRDIAAQAGVTSSTVSRALQGKPTISLAVRQQIQSIAKELGYVPSARLSRFMAEIRDAKSKDLLPVAWLNTSWDEHAWEKFRFHTPYIEGARARALELGYKLEEIWGGEPGLTMKRLSRILYQRGIEGVIVTHPARHLRLNWDYFASVTLGATLMVPRLHRVLPDLHFNLMLAVKTLRRMGYRRIGIVLSQEEETGSMYTVRDTAQSFHARLPPAEKIPPLIHPPWWTKGYDRTKKHTAWLKRHKPEVIVGHDSRLEERTMGAGFRVPEEVGIVHLAVDDDVLDWAGVYSQRRHMGVTAIDWLVSLMRNHQYGVPKVPLDILIRGHWQNGRTLQTPGAAKGGA